MNLQDHGKYNIIHIDPFGTICDKFGNLRPLTEEGLNVLKGMYARIYFWSSEGQKKCKELIEYNGWEKYNIRVIKKQSKRKMLKNIFYVVDCDGKFAKQFRVCSVLKRYRPTKDGSMENDDTFFISILHFWYMLDSIRIKLEKDERQLHGNFFGNARK